MSILKTIGKLAGGVVKGAIGAVVPKSVKDLVVPPTSTAVDVETKITYQPELQNTPFAGLLKVVIRPLIVVGFSFTYLYSIYTKLPLPSLFEEILLMVLGAYMGLRTWEKIKKRSNVV